MKSEAAVQREVVRYLKALGYRVWRVGQRNARGTQDPGVSDLIVIGKGRLWFMEVKREDGKQRPDQREFHRAIGAVCGEGAGLWTPDAVVCGVPPEVGYAVVRSLADVDRVLGNHGQNHDEAD